MMFRRFLVGAGFSLLAVSAQAQDNMMIVFDASGSMWGQIDGTAKIEIARSAFRDFEPTLGKASGEVGLIAYGHRRKGDCSDIEVLAQPQTGNASLIASRIETLSPKGKTPLSAAVRLAAETLGYREEAATVILFSDGVETCDADPCALSAELARLGIDFTAHVVGFGIGSEADRTQLQCIAGATGGIYRDANDAGALSDALTEITQTLAAAPKVEPQKKELTSIELSLIFEDETYRPETVTFRATDVETGKRLRLATLTGTLEVTTGATAKLPKGDWLIEAIGPAGEGSINVTLDGSNKVIEVPYVAAPVTFSVIDNGPYALKITHSFFVTPSVLLQENATYTVGLVAKGTTEPLIDSAYRFGTDPKGATRHDFMSPETAGAYEIVVLTSENTVVSRSSVQYVGDVTPEWRGARSGPIGGTLPVRLSGDLYYYNELVLSLDGEVISTASVTDLVTLDGPMLQLPDAEGTYDLSYVYGYAVDDINTVALGQIAVGNAPLPDDVDAVEAPEK